jgi:hypothetical protein
MCWLGGTRPNRNTDSDNAIISWRRPSCKPWSPHLFVPFFYLYYSYKAHKIMSSKTDFKQVQFIPHILASHPSTHVYQLEGTSSVSS